MKNREKLNAMSNEDLAPMLNCPCCSYRNQESCIKRPCEEGIQIWLEREAEE